MKGMKKLLSILMVLTLVLSLGVTAFADGGDAHKVNVTINNADKDTTPHTYNLYQIFTGTQAKSEGPLGEVQWGSGINDSAFLAALKAEEDAFDFEGENVFKDCITAADVAAALGKFENDSAAAIKFAKLAYVNRKEGTIAATVTADKANDYKGTATVDPGYYLIVDVTDEGAEYGVRNDLILQITDDINITPKYKIPSSEKKVLDTNDTTDLPITDVKPGDTNDLAMQDSADHDVGDEIFFKLTGNLPEDIAEYAELGYEIVFHDFEKNGLDYVNGSAKVYYVKESGTYTDITSATGVSVNTSPSHANCTFEVNVKNVYNLGNGITPEKGDKIVVIYKSKLGGDDLVYGKNGNWNEMYMEYTNSSYSEGKGRTPTDKVVVFTYDLDTNKVDDDNKPLDGATFKLYKEVSDSYVAKSGKSIVWVNKETGEEVSDKPAEGSEKYVRCVEVTLTEKSYTNAKGTAENAKFYGAGVDDGKYLIVETEAPAGYNKIKPFEFDITATHTPTSDEPTLETLTGTGGYSFKLEKTAESDEALGQIEIKNQQGATLPETGGIGTTIFYVVGAILAAGAVILLVTKKRVNGVEK